VHNPVSAERRFCGVRRLAIFWLACAATGFLAAIGVAFALSLALDGDGAWRAGALPARMVAQHRASSLGNTVAKPASPMLAPAVGPR
jgi:hypothetical protein